jgi:hypothetical protein
MAKKKVESEEKFKFHLTQTQIESLLLYYSNNKDKFKTVHSKDKIELYYSSETMDSTLNYIIDSFETEFDLIHFKSLHVDLKEKTVDIMFDSQYRCDPQIANLLIKKYYR